jgi:hypothetical protein
MGKKKKAQEECYVKRKGKREIANKEQRLLWGRVQARLHICTRPPDTGTYYSRDSRGLGASLYYLPVNCSSDLQNDTLNNLSIYLFLQKQIRRLR